MRILAILSFALSLLAQPATALEGMEGPVLFDGGRGIGACTMIRGERANYYCLRLGCDAGGAPYFALLTGSPPVLGDATLMMRENGQGLAPLRLSQSHAYEGDAYIWVAAFDPARHRAILSAMARGAALDMLLAGPGGHDTWRASLADARGKVAGVLAACAAPGTAPGPLPASARPPAPEPLPAEAEAILMDIRADCARVGGALTVSPDFAARPDLNGDGLADLVVNTGGATCSAWPPQPYCGSAGCDHTGYLARPDGSMQEIFNSLIRGYALKRPGVLTFSLHGSSCGLVGAAPCQRDFAIVGNGLELIE